MIDDHLGTIAGLIADLKAAHQRYRPCGDATGYMCRGCDYYTAGESGWPCPTMEIVQRHKRGQWHLGEFYSNAVRTANGLTHYVKNVNTGGFPEFEGTAAECEAWINRQVIFLPKLGPATG